MDGGFMRMRQGAYSPASGIWGGVMGSSEIG